MKKLFLGFIVVVVLLQISSCKDNISDIISNPGTPATKLELRFDPTSLISAFPFPGCWNSTSNSFTADISVEVDVISIDVTGNITGILPYAESPFTANNLFLDSDGSTTFLVEIPETGMFRLRIEIESEECSYCCYGTENHACGLLLTEIGEDCTNYNAGFPAWKDERLYESNPTTDFNNFTVGTPFGSVIISPCNDCDECTVCI